MGAPACASCSFVWRDNGVAIANATNASYWATQSGNYSVTVTSASNCTATSGNASITAVVSPAATITTVGSPTICSGNSLTMYANIGSGLTYQWLLNGTNIGGATAPTYTTTTAGSYTVQVTSNATCSSISSATVVNILATPTATITAAGPTTFCQGSSVTLLSNTAAGYTYQWQINNVNIPGADSAVYTDTMSGNLTVIISNGPCSTVSAPVTVNANSLPASVITSSTNQEVICFGQSITLSVPSVSGFTYQWSDTGVSIPGANSPYLTVSDSGNYTVTVSNGAGCSATSQAVHVLSDTAINPVIYYNSTNNYLYTGNSYASYQWYFNGVAVPYATSYTYTPTGTGSVTVEVKDAAGCSQMSGVYGTSVKHLLKASDVRLYPNPATTVVNIDAPVPVNVSILNLQGAEVMHQDNAKLLDITTLANGIYMIKVYDQDNNLIKNERLVKNNW